MTSEQSKQIPSQYKNIWKHLKANVPSLLPFCDEIGKYKRDMIDNGIGLYTEKNSPADYLYIISYYDKYRDELPAEAEEQINAYKAKYGME